MSVPVKAGIKRFNEVLVDAAGTGNLKEFEIIFNAIIKSRRYISSRTLIFCFTKASEKEHINILQFLHDKAEAKEAEKPQLRESESESESFWRDNLGDSSIGKTPYLDFFLMSLAKKGKVESVRWMVDNGYKGTEHGTVGKVQEVSDPIIAARIDEALAYLDDNPGWMVDSRAEFMYKTEMAATENRAKTANIFKIG